MRSLTRFVGHPLLRAALAITGLGVLTSAVVRVALDQRQPPDRCPAGMLADGPRCCGSGQRLRDGRCWGRATRCASTQEPTAEGQCVARFGVVSLAGGELFIGATDWEGLVGDERFPRTRVEPFRIDSSEVTYERYRACLSCEPRQGEPGLPVVAITARDAEAFCRSQGGRLPTAAEWVWAAAGAEGRRFAWGNTGLVCRRASFGLLAGPCSENGRAELAGSRPDGASPDGILDLCGNAAEWAREPGRDRYSARGGSYRSSAAAALKTWAAEACCDGNSKAPHIGFRCAYPP